MGPRETLATLFYAVPDTTLNLIAIERFHPMKSENILPNILSKKIYIALEQKIAQKKMLVRAWTLEFA
jgi:hypothetical protein